MGSSIDATPLNASSDVGASRLAVPSHRLFFALWPGDSLRRALAGRATALVTPDLGRAQRPDQLHMTLEFLGSVPADRLPAILDAAAEVRAGPFEVLLDALEHWRRPQVLCLVAREVPAALTGLVQALRAGLSTRGFDIERRPYRAHVTLGRKVARPPDVAVTEPVRWPASDFVLVESMTEQSGSAYRPLAAWPLRA
jgi:2'-5' RNA ligase